MGRSPVGFAQGGPALYNRAVGRDPDIRRFSWAFVGLLLLATLWPAPVVWINDLTIDATIRLNDRSFLGREAPSWDVAFWCIAGLFVIAMFDRRKPGSRDRFISLGARVRSIPGGAIGAIRALAPQKVVMGIVGSAVFLVLIALAGDLRIVALVESVDLSGIYPFFRLANRLSGGPIPLMIVAFFGLAGVLLDRARWLNLALAMATAGIAAGALTQMAKLWCPRARPELWIGPFERASAGAGSFPSGHTMSAFVIATVLFLGARSRSFRAVALLLAAMVAVARVTSFRHWPSDVMASAVIGSVFGWIFANALEEPYDPRMNEEAE